MRKFIKILILSPIIFILSGCFSLLPRVESIYRGDYPALFTVAVRSVPGIGDFAGRGGPTILMLETDYYGRVLFEYSDAHFGHSIWLIMQKTDGEYVHFYPYYNFIWNTRRTGSFEENIPDFQYEVDLQRWLELQAELRYKMENELDYSDIRETMSSLLRRTADFPEWRIEELKQANSWDQPISDTNEFIRARITREQDRGPVSAEILTEVSNEVSINIFNLSRPTTNFNNVVWQMLYLRTDDYGRSIYANGQSIYLFQPDHSFCIETGFLQLTDRWRYQTELRLFMEKNGWNTPFVSE